MGRKSNAKKSAKSTIKEMLEEKAQKQKSKKAPKPTPEITQAPKPQKPAFDLKKTLNTHKKRLKIFVTILASLIIVIFAYTLLQSVFRPADIAKFLPADSVVALVTVNTNEQHDQHIKAEKLLKDHPFSKANLIELLNLKTPYNFQADIQPWLGRQAGLALLKDSDQKLQTYIFAEYKSQELATQFQQKFPDQSFIIHNYLVFGPENSLKNQILETENPLSKNNQYQKTINHLPSNQAAFLYINFPNVSEDLLKKVPFINTASLSINDIKPILKTLNSEGLVLTALDNNFSLQSYLALSEEKLDQAIALKSRHDYNGDLLELLDENTLAVWGGENLENRLRIFLELLTGGTEQNAALFDKIVEQYTEKYFGPDINFNQDILPLFRKEFAFAIEEVDGKKAYKFLLQVSFPDKDAQKLHEIANSFASMGAIFEPQIVEHTLSDGTIAREIVAIPEKILKDKSIYNNTEIYELKMGSQGWGIYYSLIDGIAIFSDNKKSLQHSLDLLKNPSPNLTTTTAYNQNIKPVLKTADEMTYLNLAKILQTPPFKDHLPATFQTIKSLATGNAYFEGGIMSINYFDL